MLKLNKKASIPLHRLPFIGGKSKLLLGYSFWNVPSEGGYGGGCTTGCALAKIWIKHLEEESRSGNDIGPSTLSRVVIEMISMGANDSINGQAAGFFSVIEEILFTLIKNSTVHFNIDEVEQISKANNGLVYANETDNQAYDK
ncbi:Aspartokinase (EC [Kosakonia radicincitans]|uniref:hypothetical protein n=1 Tax=Kosakonia radicincitans TaxID=283686 RepID=UPI00118390AF|nr:hypothetical protein [Kosakonia radicincitans]VVT53980.1 Aspartokinase (EC [Kosakonia radicincitans]